MSTKAQRAQQEARDLLINSWGIKPGDTLYTTVVHVTSSGMSRTIKVIRVDESGPHDISHLVAQATGQKYDRDRSGVKVGGCGMDMTFAVIYDLSRSLFPDGHECTGDRTCSSNDHSNDYGYAQRLAVDELRAEGDDVYGYTESDEDRLAQHRRMRERMAVIVEREGLDYRKGRRHSDGGYALNRRNL